MNDLVGIFGSARRRERFLSKFKNDDAASCAATIIELAHATLESETWVDKDTPAYAQRLAAALLTDLLEIVESDDKRAFRVLDNMISLALAATAEVAEAGIQRVRAMRRIADRGRQRSADRQSQDANHGPIVKRFLGAQRKKAGGPKPFKTEVRAIVELAGRAGHKLTQAEVARLHPDPRRRTYTKNDTTAWASGWQKRRRQKKESLSRSP